MRTVRITSIAFAPRPVDQFTDVLLREAERHPGIILLPETCAGEEPQTPGGPMYALCGRAASEGKCYVAAGMYRLVEGRRLNSAVVFAPDGAVCGIYDKAYPYWTEFDLALPCTPGAGPAVVETAFGKLGLPICFDANFPHLWAGMAELGADLFLWASAYSAGTTLTAHALNNHIPIVTASSYPDCQVYDITGERSLHQTGRDLLVTHVTLDLDRRIYHDNFNREKLPKLLAERPEVALVREMQLEQWFVLASCDEGVCVRDLAREYGLEELPVYRRRSRMEIDRMRP